MPIFRVLVVRSTYYDVAVEARDEIEADDVACRDVELGRGNPKPYNEHFESIEIREVEEP